MKIWELKRSSLEPLDLYTTKYPHNKGVSLLQYPLCIGTTFSVKGICATIIHEFLGKLIACGSQLHNEDVGRKLFHLSVIWEDPTVVKLNVLSWVVSESILFFFKCWMMRWMSTLGDSESRRKKYFWNCVTKEIFSLVFWVLPQMRSCEAPRNPHNH